jgi:hypothetical protein
VVIDGTPIEWFGDWGLYVKHEEAKPAKPAKKAA